MTEIQDSRERIGRHSHSKGVPKQVIQTWSVMGEAFDLESRYKVIDYLGERMIDVCDELRVDHTDDISIK